MKYEYLVVGLGLAGISFCERLEENGKTYRVISDDSQISSLVAGGLYNPVILKRFNLAWNADVQLETALPFYTKLEKKLGVKLSYRIPIHRRFASTEEQNLWFEASDKPRLNKFLSTRIVENRNDGIDAPLGFGEVKYTGRIDTGKLVAAYKTFLRKGGNIMEETFDFDVLELKENGIGYKSLEASKIVFATGFGLRQNPYFNYLPLNGSKGELLTIKVPGLKVSNIIKSSAFIVPLGNDQYLVGATYDNTDKSNTPSENAKKELLDKLHTFLKCDYEVVGHTAGVRPTVMDRRPLVGRHPEHGNLYVLNGFGSRGVLMAPTMSIQLFDYIEKGDALSREVDISRFSERYFPFYVNTP